MPENGADLAHLPQVHSPLLLAGTDLRFMWAKMWDFGKHVWDGTWTEDPEPDKHCGTLRLIHRMCMFGIHIPILDMKVLARQVSQLSANQSLVTFTNAPKLIKVINKNNYNNKIKSTHNQQNGKKIWFSKRLMYKKPYLYYSIILYFSLWSHQVDRSVCKNSSRIPYSSIIIQ